jgi:hypothetical protein
MTHPRLHRLDIGTGRDQQRCQIVPQIMEATRCTVKSGPFRVLAVIPNRKYIAKRSACDSTSPASTKNIAGLTLLICKDTLYGFFQFIFSPPGA